MNVERLITKMGFEMMIILSPLSNAKDAKKRTRVSHIVSKRVTTLCEMGEVTVLTKNSGMARSRNQVLCKKTAHF